MWREADHFLQNNFIKEKRWPYGSALAVNRSPWFEPGSSLAHLGWYNTECWPLWGGIGTENT